jgi:hypothetical protein
MIDEDEAKGLSASHKLNDASLPYKINLWGLSYVVIFIIILALFGTNATNKYQRVQAEDYKMAIQSTNVEVESESVALKCKTDTKQNTTFCSGELKRPKTVNLLETADLRAQQDMSTWAFSLLWVSIAGTVLSAFGAWFIWETLSATRETVKEARRATVAAEETVRVSQDAARESLNEARRATAAAEESVKVAKDAARATLLEAKRSTKAAEESVNVAKDAAQRQLRAYVSVKPLGSIFDQNGHFTPRILTKNDGQTPAHSISCKGSLQILKPDQKFEEFQPGNQAIEAITLAASADLTKTFPFSKEVWPTEEQLLEVMNGNLVLNLVGIVEYKDVFDKEYYTHFAFVYKNGRYTEKDAIISPSGNHST